MQVVASELPSLQEAMWKVGVFDVDTQRNRLLFGDEQFTIEPLVMDVLCLMMERAGQLVTRCEIIDHVWMTGAGGDESLTRAIGILRRVFAHDDSGTPYIETFWKRGYSLIAPVVSIDIPTGSSSQLAVSVRASPIPNYSVAVLPFKNASNDSEDSFLADGITRDLTMLLSRVPRLRVAAYSSALLWQEGQDPLPQIAKGLGVRYVVSGSLARSGDKFQLRAALMDAGDDAQLWAKRLDAPLTEFFRVQDELVLEISMSLASALQMSHMATIQGRRPFQLSAYELVQRAEALRLKYNRETAREIVGLLDQALTIDPNDASVHAALAVQHTQNVVSSFVRNAGETFALAKQHVDTALRIAPRDPDTLAAAGVAATMMGNARRAVRHLQEAVELDPNNPHTLAVLGWQHCWLNGTREGIVMIETAEARAPNHPRHSVWAHYRGHCEIRLGEVARAVSAYRDGEARNPGYGLNLATLATGLALLGDWEESVVTIKRLHEVSPAYTPEDLAGLARRMVYWFGCNPSRETYIAAFREAWLRAECA